MSSTKNTDTMNVSAILSALQSIEAQVSAMRSVVNTLSEAKPSASAAKPLDKMKSQELRDLYASLVGKPSGLKSTGKFSNKTLLIAEIQRLQSGGKPSTSDTEAEAKPKKEINPKIAAYNEERKVIFQELISAWESANPTFASLSKADLKKAVAEGKVSKRPSFPDALKEHSRRLREKDPQAEERHKQYLEKRQKAKETKQTSAASATAASETQTVASSDSEGKKKRGPKPGYTLSEEEKAKRKAKRLENANKKKLASAPALPPSPASSDSEDTLSEKEEDTYLIKEVKVKGKKAPIKVWMDSDGKTYALSANNSFGEWLGIYNASTSTFTVCPAPE